MGHTGFARGGGFSVGDAKVLGFPWRLLGPCFKNIGLVTGPGGLFAKRLVTESGGLATNPPCDKAC